MFFQVKSYLQFLYNSSNQHGIHSPFVYDLITKCFYAKTDLIKLQQITKYRSILLDNHDKIDVTDFGKGSRVFKTNRREIAKIAKVAGITQKRSKLLFRLNTYFRPKNILEIGTSLGIGTASMGFACPNAKITTLEGCTSTANVAQSQFNKFDLSNINLIVGDFKKTVPKIINDSSFDLIYFDGNHQKKPTLEYFEQCLPSAHNDTIFIFDDIHWSKEMAEAWGIIKNHPKVTVTIDTYFWGFIFFRKEQLKEHFVIRV